MDNDLSLSQSFGGLRIANPDDVPPETSRELPTDAWMEEPNRVPTQTREANPSPPAPKRREARPPSDAQPQSRRLSFFNILRRGESACEASSKQQPQAPEPKSVEVPPQPNRSSSPKSQDNAAKAAAAKAYRQVIPMNHQAQKQAQLQPYQPGAQNGNRSYVPPGTARPVSGVYAAAPPPGAVKPREPGTYRLRSESSQSSIGGITRSSSRGATAMQAGVPSREAEHRDRSYSQSLPMGNGPLPPRRSSRGMGGGHTESLPSAPNVASGPPRYDSDGNLVMSSEEWKDKGAAVGVRQEYDEHGNLVTKHVKKGVRDFVFGRTLGEGSYSTVLLATDRQTLKEYAVKILDKKHIIKEKKIKYVNIEKDTLNRLMEHPGIVRLYYTFQDNNSLYYVLDVASGGELLGVLKKIGSFDVECTRFYAGEILCAIEHMHNRGVIHRDLKPENVLLDEQMHIRITDFGTAKLGSDPRKPPSPPNISEHEPARAKSFVGTAEYVSPELLTDKHACKASDLWAFGCIVYQLLAGRPPFKASNEYQTFQKIVSLDYEFPPGFPPAARDLVERLLVLDPQMRLSIEHIKNHEFFDGLSISTKLWNMKAPRLKPYVPPAQEPTLIKLTGTSNAPPPVAVSRPTQPPPASNGNSRPQPRVITELPPPTQLDIEWSPVLTRNNERILKLGNLMVMSTPLPHSPNSKNGGEGHERKGFAKFFGGNTTKKRQRLVMVTSSARLIFAAARGDEKKTKSELSLLAPDCTWRTQVDAKGQTVFCIDTRGQHYTFEDAKSTATTIEPSKTSAEDWIESIERAKDIALSQSMIGSYNSDNGFDMTSVGPSPTSTLQGNVYPEAMKNSGRHHITKSQASLSEEHFEGKKKVHRFSKRQSKNGLSTPF